MDKGFIDVIDHLMYRVSCNYFIFWPSFLWNFLVFLLRFTLSLKHFFMRCLCSCLCDLILFSFFRFMLSGTLPNRCNYWFSPLFNHILHQKTCFYQSNPSSLCDSMRKFVYGVTHGVVKVTQTSRNVWQYCLITTIDSKQILCELLLPNTWQIENGSENVFEGALLLKKNAFFVITLTTLCMKIAYLSVNFAYELLWKRFTIYVVASYSFYSQCKRCTVMSCIQQVLILNSTNYGGSWPINLPFSFVCCHL